MNIKKLRFNAGVKAFCAGVVFAITGISLSGDVTSIKAGNETSTKNKNTIDSFDETATDDNVILEDDEKKVYIESTEPNKIEKSDDESEEIKSPNGSDPDPKEKTPEITTPSTDKKEEVVTTNAETRDSEDLVVDFTNYALGYGLTSEEYNAIILAMNGEMSVFNTDVQPELNSDDFTLLLNRAIDNILNGYYKDNTKETFDLTKAIISTPNAEAEAEMLEKFIQPIKEFKNNPTKDNFSEALLSLNDIYYSNVDGENGIRLSDNQRSMAVRLYSNYMYGYAVNSGYNTKSNAVIMQQLNDCASTPYSFTYNGKQLDCEKIYSSMK